MAPAKTATISEKSREKRGKTDFSSARSLSVSDAAHELGLSPPTVRRMVRDGELKAFHTPGGHVRIPVAAIQQFQAGPAEETDAAEGPSPVLRNRRERIEELALEAEELRAKRQLDHLRREQDEEEAERQAGEAERQQQIHAAEEARISEQRQLERQDEREREKRFSEQKLKDFRDCWVRFGNEQLRQWQFGWLFASQRKEVCEAIEDEVRDRDLSDESRMGEIVTQAIRAAVEPWEHARKQETLRQQLIERTVNSLPYSATAADRSAVSLTLQTSLSRAVDANESQLRALAEQAVLPIRKQIQKRDLIERVITFAVFGLPAGRTNEDEAVFRRKCQQALSKVPDDITEIEIKRAIKGVISEASEKITARENRQQVREQRGYLISYGMSEAASYLSLLCIKGEIDYEDISEIKASLRDELEEEISGQESRDEVREFVRETIKDQL